MQHFDHNIGFWEKRQFFRRKLSKIAENCDHNIDPRKRAFLVNSYENCKFLSTPINFLTKLHIFWQIIIRANCIHILIEIWTLVDLEDGSEERPAEDERGVVVRQRIAEGWHVAVAKPARVVHLGPTLRFLAKIFTKNDYPKNYIRK
jgi:hypothetical protein